MIRKLKEEDRKKVLEYLYKEAAYNIFIIGDIETFGFNTDFQTIYGEFDDFMNYQSVLLFYNENSVYYSHLNYFNPEYKTILDQHEFNFISGKEELMKLVKPYIKDSFSYNPMYFCQATEIQTDIEIKEEIKHLSSEDELGKLYDLLSQIEEFGIQNIPKDKYIESSKQSMKMGTKLYIEKDGIMVSTVSTTADTTVNAMIIAVATHENYRKKGYASELMVYLMKEYLLNRNKSLCLFYDNPQAGKIYKRLGFKDLGKWVMMSDLK